VSTRPPCDNCGEPSTHLASHDEAGGVHVCPDCIHGHGLRYIETYEQRDKRLAEYYKKKEAQP
jgi:hypothetical protein